MIAPAVASSAFAAPVFMDERKDAIAESVASDAKSEAIAEKVVNASEGAYGVNTGQRRNHTKGVGALGSFVGMQEAAEYSRSPLFSGQELGGCRAFFGGRGIQMHPTRRKARAGSRWSSGCPMAACST